MQKKSFFISILIACGLIHAASAANVSCPSAQMMKNAAPILSIPYAFDNKQSMMKTLSLAELEDKAHEAQWAIVLSHLPVSTNDSPMDVIQSTLTQLTPVFNTTHQFQILNHAFFDEEDEKDSGTVFERHMINYCVYQSSIADLSVFAIYSHAPGDESTMERMHRIQRDVRLAKMMLK